MLRTFIDTDRVFDIISRVETQRIRILGVSTLSKRKHTDSSFITYGNVQDAVADAIRSRILSGDFEPGARLRQDELAKSFDVSTMPIREALRHLEADGLVTIHPRRGASVTDLSEESLDQAL